VFSACLAFGDAIALLCGTVLLAGAYLWISPRLFPPALSMLYRMRWFLLSLLIVYGWFTPGPPLIGEEGARFAALWPSRAGLSAGLLRAALLAGIVSGANLLLRTTTREQLLIAVYGLARPLAPLGISRERIAVRMVLVIEALDPVRRIVTEQMAALGGVLQNLRSAGRFASGVMLQVVQQAEGAARATVDLPRAGAPALRQWIYPLLLWGVFWCAARFSA
jgi:energy-coupling factor transport system permease protein